MIRFVRLYAWLRWRFMANTLKSRRRDSLEQISRVFQVVTPFLLGALLLGSLCALAVLGFVGGRLLAGSDAAVHATALLAIRGGLFMAVGLMVFVPVAGATTGVTTEYRRLLLLPVSRRQLHTIEVLATALDHWALMVIVALLAIAAGLGSRGALAAAGTAIAAGAAFAGVLVTLCQREPWQGGEDSSDGRLRRGVLLANVAYSRSSRRSLRMDAI
jgi:hypothetical protein